MAKRRLFVTAALTLIVCSIAVQSGAEAFESGSEFNPRYRPIVTVRGTILDVNSNAVLYVKSDRTLISMDRVSSASTIIRTNFHGWTMLTPTGVIMHIHATDVPREVPVLDVNRGEEINLGFRGGAAPLGDGRRVVEGRFGVVPILGYGVILRDFVAKTNHLLFDPRISPITADVAENGSVAFTTSPMPNNWRVHWYDGETVRELTTASLSRIPHVQTDGTNVLWTSPNAESIYLLSGTERITLATNVNITGDVWDRHTAMNSGWTAFPRLGIQGQREIWRRSPEGVITQATFYPNNSHVRSLGSDGSLLVAVEQTNSVSALVYVAPDGAAKQMGNDFEARFISFGAEFFAYAAGTLFSIEVEGEPFWLATPRFDSAAGTLSYDIVASEAGTFVLERSADLVNWGEIATNTVTSPLPSEFQVVAPPGFFRLRRALD